MTSAEQVDIARRHGISVWPDHHSWRASIERCRGAGVGGDPYEALHGLWKCGSLSVWDRDRVASAIHAIKARLNPGNICPAFAAQCERVTPLPTCPRDPLLAEYDCYPRTKPSHDEVTP